MRKALPLGPSLRLLIVLGQDQRSGWTDKKNGQQYAAYQIEYMSPDVRVKRCGEEDVFVVNPGPRLPENLARQAVKVASKAGDVYCSDRVNDWPRAGRKNSSRQKAWRKSSAGKKRDRTASLPRDGHRFIQVAF